MSYSPKTATLEQRVAELEAICDKQDKRIRTLAAVFSITNPSPFESPLKRFFEGPGMLDIFDDVEEELECNKRCREIYDQQIKAAGSDEDKKQAALKAFSNCLFGCNFLGLVPRWGKKPD